MRYFIIVFSSAALLSGAFFLSGTAQATSMILIMMATPLLAGSDNHFTILNYRYIKVYIIGGIATLYLLSFDEVTIMHVLHQLIYAAIPEETYFRTYLVGSLGMSLRANVISSVFFSIIHGITRGWIVAFSVFLPSLAFGIIYIKYRDLGLVIMCHTLSNLLYFAVIDQHVAPLIYHL